MKAPLFYLLLLCTGFTISLILVRIFYAESLTYVFFVWNLFLASVPLLLSSLLIQTSKRKVQLLLFSGWLLFFPNALYIITDLVHLKVRNNIPLWFDVILIFSAAINGLIMAYLSLEQIEFFLQTKFNNYTTKTILFACLSLASFGVFIGRFLRLNSWDILTNSSVIALDIVPYFVDPFHHSHTWAMTIILTSFFCIFYFTIKKIARLNCKPAIIISINEN